MFSIAVGVFSVVAAWRWGDWRHWGKYLPTIQYFVSCDMLYNLLTWNYRLWIYPPGIFPNHLTMSLFMMFVLYPSFLLIYLYRFPTGPGPMKKILFLLSAIALWSAWEWVLTRLGNCVYDHGWTYLWSIAFLCVMVPMLWLHHVRPALAYLLSVPITVFLLLWFHVPVFARG